MIGVSVVNIWVWAGLAFQRWDDIVPTSPLPTGVNNVRHLAPKVLVPSDFQKKSEGYEQQ